MKVWITKYALSDGIRILECTDEDIKSNGYFYRSGNSFKEWDRLTHFYSANDFHHTEVEAITRAEEMRKRKIANLKKQIEKLEKLSFTTNKEGNTK